MKKVLLLQGTIPHYRIPIFNELAKKVDRTVVYSYDNEPLKVGFTYKYVPIVKFIIRFIKKIFICWQKNLMLLYVCLISRTCIFDCYIYFPININ